MASQKRPPVIVVVGHIDHGKSKLQKAIRESELEFFEVGDITQQIGAYELHAECGGVSRKATVIDTPGHEAFSHIREHGIWLSDLALLVVSAEEGWKEQTTEAYNLIQEHKTPFIVVFTKLDTDKADVERAKYSVLNEGVLLEGLGGSVPWIAVSSTTGQGISDLVELIFLTSDVYELTEKITNGSVGVLVEADIDAKTGIAGTIIVLDSKLEEKKYISVGSSIAPLRIMENDRKVRIKAAEPPMPVRVVGFNSIPEIGAFAFLHNSKKEALEAAKQFALEKSSTDIASAPTDTMKKILPVVIRSDTASGIQSLQKALEASADEGIMFKVIKQDVGNISEEDIRMSGAEKESFVLGFHTDIETKARALAERSGVTFHLFQTIYEVVEWRSSMLSEKKNEYQFANITGKAEVIRVFEEQKAGERYIIGAQIEEGEFRVEQEVVVQKNSSEQGRFIIKNIEQRNKSQESVSGVKTQFALQVKGAGHIEMGDTICGLPAMDE